MKSRSQEFANDVWNKIPVFVPSSDNAKKYGAWAHSLPILIRTSGLAHTLAFVISKSPNGSQERDMLNDFAQVVLANNTATAEGLTDRVRTCDLQLYMHLTRRSLEVCVWFKRFAESKLGIKAGEGDSNDSTQ